MNTCLPVLTIRTCWKKKTSLTTFGEMQRLSVKCCITAEYTRLMIFLGYTQITYLFLIAFFMINVI